MAAFEISPVPFLVSIPNPLKFWGIWLVFTLLAFVIWILNFLLISFEESKKPGKVWKRYISSYVLTLLLVAIIWVISLFVNIPERNEHLSIFFPIINMLTLNTIILILSDAILARSKKAQTETELSNLKIKHLEAEQQQLIQQMQPHFLFNALSTLNSIIGTDAVLAKKYLVKLSNFLRFTISAHENAIISLSDELNFTRDYIDLQCIRFEGSFFCTISISQDEIRNFNIPVYALQSLVENAIKHNLFNDTRPLNVKITLQNDCIVVSNNKLIKPKSLDRKNEGVGLKNLNQRYRLCSGSDILIEETNQDFRVTLKLIK